MNIPDDQLDDVRNQTAKQSEALAEGVDSWKNVKHDLGAMISVEDTAEVEEIDSGYSATDVYKRQGRIPLEGLPNTRDLGGIHTMDGKQIVPARLIRSGALYEATPALSLIHLCSVWRSRRIRAAE